MKIQKAYEHAAKTLEPYFGLKGMQPKVVVNHSAESAYYDDVENIIISTESQIDYRDFTAKGTIGHETGHFLHHACNPDIFNRLKRYKPRKLDVRHLGANAMAVNFIECIGSYSGLVYQMEESAGAVKVECAFHEDTKNFTWRKICSANTSKPGFVGDALHTVGKMMAADYYLKHRDAKLRALARVPFDEAVEIISKYIDWLLANEI